MVAGAESGVASGVSVSVSGPARLGLAARACPVHLTEPSGQKATGHVWTLRRVPLAAVRRSGVAGCTALCGHGTSQLTPTGAAGARSPSQ